MKRTIIAIAAAGALFAVADISGDFNTWLGHLAGQNADGERTTVVGAGAGGEAHAQDKSTYIGAAAGTYSQGATESVSIGYRAMRGATNCTRCVAIGSGAMQGEIGTTGCVVIGPHASVDSMFRTGWTDVNGLVRGVSSEAVPGSSQVRIGAPWENITDCYGQGLDHWFHLQLWSGYIVHEDGAAYFQIEEGGTKYRVRLERVE